MNYKSIVHRDLKPENILVERLKNGFEIFKIIDFDVAKNNQEHNRWSDPLDRMTNPPCMAPEKII